MDLVSRGLFYGNGENKGCNCNGNNVKRTDAKKKNGNDNVRDEMGPTNLLKIIRTMIIMCVYVFVCVRDYLSFLSRFYLRMHLVNL